MDPAFDECGEICGDTEEPQNFYCDTCPMKQAQNEFRDECLEWLDIRAKDVWRKYGFDLLLKEVLNAFSFERLPLEHQSVRSARLIAIKDQEIARMKRIDAWNAKKDKDKETYQAD